MFQCGHITKRMKIADLMDIRFSRFSTLRTQAEHIIDYRSFHICIDRICSLAVQGHFILNDSISWESLLKYFPLWIANDIAYNQKYF